MAVWTSPDWSLPLESSLYTDVLDYIDFRLDDLATGLVDTLTKTYTNLPVNTQRWNSTTLKWEKWSGTAWADLTATYGISISGTASNITGTLAVAKGGTNLTSYTIGDLLYASAATTLAKLPAVAVGKVLISGGVATAPSWGSVDLETHTVGILPVSKGGIGVSTITGLMYGNGANDVTSASAYIDINTTSSLVTLAGALKITGNSIQSSTAAAITLSGADVAISGDLTITGNDIKSSAATVLSFSGANVTVAGDLTVAGNDISSSTAVAITLSGANVAVAGTLSSGGALSVTGAITATGNITAYSDIRLKSNIETVTNALDKTCKLRGVYFDQNNLRNLGVIAQEIEAIVPEVVQNNEQYKSVAYGNLVGLLIEAIKELNAKVERLENAG